MKSSEDQTHTSTTIVLHAPDGCFPYLAPHLLQKCFPAAAYSNLELAISAQDSCVTPKFGRSHGDTKKPSGYCLSPFSPDDWIRPYAKIAVPAFDPFGIVPSPKNVRCGRTAKNEIKTLNMNTINGRIQITTNDYEIMTAGKFRSALSLFECPSKNAKDRKHILERTLEWTSAMLIDTNVPDVWLPVSVCSVQEDADAQEIVDRLCEWIQDGAKERLSTVCLIDWHLVKDGATRRSILRIFDRALPSNLGLAILAAHDVESLSDALCFGMESDRALRIGTNVPTTMAQQYQSLSVKRENETPPSKKLKAETSTDDASTAEIFICTSLQPHEPPVAHPWFKDPGPIDVDCSCMTCQEHSRSYLYHLACSKELLVEILLFVHNLHQILQAEAHLRKR